MSNAPSLFVKTANRIIDFFLSVDTNEVLNTGSTSDAPENPAAEMMKASKQLLAAGIDSKHGGVDYSALAGSESYARFRDISRSLNNYNPTDIRTGDEATAFWINIYNALIIDGIIFYRVEGSLLRRPGFFRQVAYRIGGVRFSADAIEHGLFRNNRPNPALPIPIFASDDPRNRLYKSEFDPRIHFTLVCGATSCPPISFYDAESLEQQLEMAAAAFVNGSGVRFDAQTNTLWLSSIFNWYQGDFGGLDSVLQMIRAYHNNKALVDRIALRDFRTRYIPYDWSVNRAA